MSKATDLQLPGAGEGVTTILNFSAAALPAALAVALCMGLADGAMAGGGAGTLLLSLGLYAPVGLAVGLLWGLVGGGLAATLPDGLWARLRDDEALDRRVAAGLWAAAASLSVELALVFLFVASAAGGMANKSLAALSTGLVAAAGVLVCAALFFPLWVLLRGPARLLPRLGSATVTTLLLLVLATAGAALLVLGRVDWRVLRFGPWIMLALLGVVSVALCCPLRKRLQGKRALLVGVAALLVGAGLGLAAPTLGQGEGVVAPAQEGVLLPLLISTGRKLKDGDGDGYSPWFEGGDCDDASAAVNPEARDIPGNGVDENCLGGDARIKKAPKPRSSSGSTAAPQKPKKPAFDGNILLLCIDTLRADKLGVMGHTGGLSPNLDRLAKEGVLFSQAFAQGPNTPQSFPSIFTSLYPTRVPYRKRFTGYPAVKPEATTVFEVLAAGGFTTAAVTSHFYFKKRRGITQGVADWDNAEATNLKDSNKDISAPRIVPRAIRKLKALAAANKRFALFVHLFEPHSTYVRHRQFPITKRGVAGLQQKYDHEIKFVDLWVGKLLDGLKAAGLDQKTAIIAFSDHGEAFGEHRLYFHGQALFNEVINVPLIVRIPGGPQRVVKHRVALLDIAPTMLELAGLQPPASFQGRSLLPAVRGEALPPRLIGAVLMPYPAWPKGHRAMISGDHKVIHRYTENLLEIYDLAGDPGEKQNLARSQPQLAKKLRQELGSFVEDQL